MDGNKPYLDEALKRGRGREDGNVSRNVGANLGSPLLVYIYVCHFEVHLFEIIEVLSRDVLRQRECVQKS